MREEFEARKKEWFAWDKWSGKEPGLFKLEFEGKRGIALCSKCYFMEKEDGKTKVSSKRVSKRQNQLSWKRYNAALEWSEDMATNIGMRMNGGVMCTYEQNKLGLSAYYDKHWVLEDDRAHRVPPQPAGGRTVSSGIINSSSRTKPRLGPSRK